MCPQAKYKKKPRAMQVYSYLDILRKTPLDIFPPNTFHAQTPLSCVQGV